MANDFNTIPRSFQEDLIDQIFSAVGKGHNVQLVGVKGSGKALLFRQMGSYSAGYKVIHLDLRLLIDPGFESLFASLKEIKGEKTLVLISSFEYVLRLPDTKFLDFLDAIYMQNMDNLKFVFSLERELTETELARMGDFAKRVICPVIYLPALEKSDAFWFLGSAVPGVKPDVSLKKKIFEATGGVEVLMKRVLEEIRDGINLNEIIENPENYAGLAYACKAILETFKGVDLRLTDEKSVKILQKYFLVSSDGGYTSKVLENYIQNEFYKTKHAGSILGELDKTLTSSEYKILSILNSHLGEVVGRDEIMEKLWGIDGVGDISDHALDQIISRLRKKVEKSGLAKIETVKGRGYKLVK